VPVGVYTATTSYFVPRVTRCLFRFFVFLFVDVIIIIIVAIIVVRVNIITQTLYTPI